MWSSLHPRHPHSLCTLQKVRSEGCVPGLRLAQLPGSCAQCQCGHSSASQQVRQLPLTAMKWMHWESSSRSWLLLCGVMGLAAVLAGQQEPPVSPSPPSNSSMLDSLGGAGPDVSLPLPHRPLPYGPPPGHACRGQCYWVHCCCALTHAARAYTILQNMQFTTLKKPSTTSCALARSCIPFPALTLGWGRQAASRSL